MENNEFDPQSEFNKATDELNNKVKASTNPLKKLFSKSKDNVKNTVEEAPSQEGFENRSTSQDEVKADNFNLGAKSPRKETKKKTSPAQILKIIAVVLIVVILILLAYVFLKPAPKTQDVPQITGVEQEVEAAESPAAEPDEEEITTDEESTIDDEVTTTDPVDVANLANPNKDDAEKSSKKESNSNKKKADVDKSSKEEHKVEAPAIKEGEIPSQELTDEAKKIIAAKIPEDQALVKEELDKLSDEAQRLEKQETLLKQRADMMDELTKKKAEQISLLEQQIAQLEAEKGSSE